MLTIEKFEEKVRLLHADCQQQVVEFGNVHPAACLFLTRNAKTGARMVYDEESQDPCIVLMMPKELFKDEKTMMDFLTDARSVATEGEALATLVIMQCLPNIEDAMTEEVVAFNMEHVGYPQPRLWYAKIIPGPEGKPVLGPLLKSPMPEPQFSGILGRPTGAVA